MLSFSDKRNQNINKKLEDITISQYLKGLKIKNEEEVGANENNDEGILDTVKPVVDIKTKKKGYNTKQKIVSTKNLLKSSKDTLKDFISQSNILDTELNQMVSQFKLNNKGDFYGGDISDDEEDDDDNNDGNDNDDQNDPNNNERIVAIAKSYNELYEKFHKGITKGLKGMDSKSMKQFIHSKYGLNVTKSKIQTKFFNVQFPKYDTNDDDFGKVTDEAEKQVDEMKELYNLLQGNVSSSSSSNDNVLEKSGDRLRSSRPGNQGHLLPVGSTSLIGDNSQKANPKEHNGLRITNNVHVKNLSNDLLLSIKKINNVIINLIPLGQNLAENHFSGATHDDINKIKKLYADMDDKMYILTSINDEATQLQKLDSDFDTLINAVNGGISSFVPMSGGSMESNYGRTIEKPKLTVYHPNRYSCKTDMLYML